MAEDSPNDAEEPAGGSAPGEPRAIGEVLSVLTEEFPDVTISKIRFLESQGLVRPERNASGYRQFGDEDVERLRWILRQQRDHFLPLKVIKKALDRGLDVPDAGDDDQPTLWSALADEAVAEEAAAEQAATEAREAAGRAVERARPAAATAAPESGATGSEGGSGEDGEPARRHRTPADVVAALQEDPRPVERRVRRRRSVQREAQDETPRPPLVPADPGAERMGRSELLEATGLSEEVLDGLESYGLVEAQLQGGEPTYDEVAVRVGTAAARMVELGVEPRHLRIYKVAAEREAGLVEQLVMPLVKQRNPAARDRAVEMAEELARLGSDVHAAVLSRELGPGLSP